MPEIIHALHSTQTKVIFADLAKTNPQKINFQNPMLTYDFLRPLALPTLWVLVFREAYAKMSQKCKRLTVKHKGEK
jgi:hypothetical protein